jgi:hypothetical protein
MSELDLDEETAALPIGRCRRIVVPGRRRYRQVSRRLVGRPDGHWTWRRPGFGCKVIGNLALLVKPEYRTDPAFPASHPDKPLREPGHSWVDQTTSDG